MRRSRNNNPVISIACCGKGKAMKSAKKKEEDLSKNKIPNQTTIEAHREALEEGGTLYQTMADLWADMGISVSVTK
jgi:hypothetical protein